MVWGTHSHHRILGKEMRPRLLDHLLSEGKQMGLMIEAINVQMEYVHVLLSLPSDMTAAHVAKSLKGESSRWINEQGLVPGRFQWQRGYGAFSVSASQLSVVQTYIRQQDEHHRRRSFAEEYEEWARRYGVWEE
jgi:putative transposase